MPPGAESGLLRSITRHGVLADSDLCLAGHSNALAAEGWLTGADISAIV